MVAEIEVNYQEGKISRKFDTSFNSIDRLTFLVSFMEVNEMRRFLISDQSSQIVKKLGMKESKYETTNCKMIWDYFNKV